MTMGDPGAVSDRSRISPGFSWSPRREDAHAPPELGDAADCRRPLEHTHAVHRHAGRRWSLSAVRNPAGGSNRLPSTIVFAVGSKRRSTPTRDAAPSGCPRSASMTPAISPSFSPCARKTTSTPSAAAAEEDVFRILRAVYTAPDSPVRTATVVGTYSVTGTRGARELPVLRTVLSAEHAGEDRLVERDSAGSLHRRRCLPSLSAVR